MSFLKLLLLRWLTICINLSINHQTSKNEMKMNTSKVLFFKIKKSLYILFFIPLIFSSCSPLSRFKNQGMQGLQNNSNGNNVNFNNGSGQNSPPTNTPPGGNTNPTTNSNFVKWHPGHYYTLTAINPSYLKTVLGEMAANPILRGIQVRYSWNDLETSEGVYNFKAIEDLLAQLKSNKIQLVLLIHFKSFNSTNIGVPDYIAQESKYEGGIFPYNHGKDKDGNPTPLAGYTAKLWNPYVRDRYIALFDALGKKFNSHPNLEGIGVTETSIGQPMINITSAQESLLFSNMIKVHQAMRAQFPNTMTYQFVNYPRSVLRSFIEGLKNTGTSLGGPDIFLTDPGLTMQGNPNTSDGVYSYYPKLSGIVPLTPSIQHQDYATTNPNNPSLGYQPSLTELYEFGKNNLKANYLFWTRNTDILPGQTQPNYQRVLNFLKTQSDITNDPTKAGGLKSECPSAYAGCSQN